tara:strand:- start:1853 stop:2134 length:282 start_codon:yes stop_codon:yes gene_type:complete
LSKLRLIKKLKKSYPKLNQEDIEDVINIFLSSLQNALREGKKIELRGFGTFFIKKIKEKYTSRNPKTGELIYVPEKNKVRFKPTKGLKELLNK